MGHKLLGKISQFEFGHVGYQDAMLGFTVSFSLEGNSGCGQTFGASWDPAIVPHSEHCQWTEADRDGEWVKGMHKVSQILKDAKAEYISELVGKPVEVILDRPYGTMQSWRILTEVL